MADDTLARVARAMAEAEALLDARRLKSALELYQRAQRADPGEPVFAYQLGALFYCYLGNGLEAKRWFQSTLAGAGSGGAEAQRRLQANACENLMLLSLSYEEYDEYANRLERLDPGNPILKDHRARVQQAKAQAQPWFVVLGSMATMHHNPHDAAGAERFGECAATWHLFLAKRDELHVPPDERRNALIGYAAALLQCSAGAGLALRAAIGFDEPQEVIFLLETAKPFLREYLAENGEDPAVQQLLATIERAFDLSRYRQRPDGAAQAVPVERPPQAVGRYLGCIVLLLGMALGALAGHFWIVKLASPWNALAGAVFGLFFTTLLISRTPLGKR